MKQKLPLTLCLVCCILWCAACPAAATETAIPHISAALMACAYEINVAPCNISVEQVGRILATALHEDPALFHVSPTLSYRYDDKGRVLTLYPSYTVTGEALTAARQRYEAEVHRLCEGVSSAWSDAEKVLYIHDLLARQYTYDLSEQNYDAYTFFRDGHGVCQAYALAFSAVARRVELAVDLVYSDAMDHAWNHVRVDGEWFHVDVTRDDPTDGNSPTVLHHRLLRSDEGMASLGYHDYTCAGTHTCSSNRFEADDGQGWLTPWHTVPLYINGGWCFSSPDGSLTPVTLSPAPHVHRPGDLSRDGQITPLDLLILRQDTACTSVPDESSHRLRQAILQEILP